METRTNICEYKVGCDGSHEQGKNNALTWVGWPHREGVGGPLGWRRDWAEGPRRRQGTAGGAGQAEPGEVWPRGERESRGGGPPRQVCLGQRGRWRLGRLESTRRGRGATEAAGTCRTRLRGPLVCRVPVATQLTGMCSQA